MIDWSYEDGSFYFEDGFSYDPFGFIYIFDPAWFAPQGGPIVDLSQAQTGGTTTLEDDTIQAVKDRTSFSVQSSTDAAATPTVLNADANILYATASRTQGNFSHFYLEAIDTFAEDLLRVGKIATDVQKARAYAYLIGDLQEKKDPDSVVQSVSVPGYSISRTPEVTGYYLMYKQFLRNLPIIDVTPDSVEGDADHVAVSEFYPDDFRMSALNRHGAPTESGYTDPW
jgi:hypothetical protein